MGTIISRHDLEMTARAFHDTLYGNLPFLDDDTPEQWLRRPFEQWEADGQWPAGVIWKLEALKPDLYVSLYIGEWGPRGGIRWSVHINRGLTVVGSRAYFNFGNVQAHVASGYLQHAIATMEKLRQFAMMRA